MPQAITVGEAKKVTKDTARQGILEIIEQNAPIISELPWTPVDTMEYVFFKEGELPSTASRNINAGYTPSTGSIEKIGIPLKIIGGEFDIDQFLLDQAGDIDDLFGRQMALRQKANAFHVEELIFEGNSLTTPSAFDGLSTLIQGGQLDIHSATGAAISLAALERILDLVPGATHIFMNRTLRTDLMGILNDASTSSGHPRISYSGLDAIGKPIEVYNAARIMVVERMDDGSTILGFDEDPGDTTSDTASIYVCRIAQDAFHGVQGKRGPTDQRSIGEDWDEPRQKGRAEWYVNIAIEHPRCVCRSYGYTS